LRSLSSDRQGPQDINTVKYFDIFAISQRFRMEKETLAGARLTE
jgi:hypothetical protein